MDAVNQGYESHKESNSRQSSCHLDLDDQEGQGSQLKLSMPLRPKELSTLPSPRQEDVPFEDFLIQLDETLASNASRPVSSSSTARRYDEYEDSRGLHAQASAVVRKSRPRRTEEAQIESKITDDEYVNLYSWTGM